MISSLPDSRDATGRKIPVQGPGSTFRRAGHAAFAALSQATRISFPASHSGCYRRSNRVQLVKLAAPSGWSECQQGQPCEGGRPQGASTRSRRFGSGPLWLAQESRTSSLSGDVPIVALRAVSCHRRGISWSCAYAVVVLGVRRSLARPSGRAGTTRAEPARGNFVACAFSYLPSPI